MSIHNIARVFPFKLQKKKNGYDWMQSDNFQYQGNNLDRKIDNSAEQMASSLSKEEIIALLSNLKLSTLREIITLFFTLTAKGK